VKPEHHRLLTIALAVAVVVLGSMLVTQKSKTAQTPDAGADAGSAVAAGAAGAAADMFGLTDAGEALGEMVREATPDTRVDAGVGSKMADGTSVPPLPTKAPRQVRFGVILVSYAGAQGAPPSARSKSSASDLALKLSEGARADFKGTVAKGDPGSAEDVGRVPRGVLELAPEYALFMLPVNGVSEPIDTPKGFWIVKRTE
jgi:hypothetical protein